MTDQERIAAITARWELIPVDEQPRIAVTNSTRGGTLLNALGHARHDVPFLLAEIAERDAENAELQGKLRVREEQLKRLDPELVRLRAENAELIRALGLNEEVAA